MDIASDGNYELPQFIAGFTFRVFEGHWSGSEHKRRRTVWSETKSHHVRFLTKGIKSLSLFIGREEWSFAKLHILKLQLIPLAMETTETQEVAAECEPSEEQIIEQLLPRNLAVQCFTCLLTSSASEQAARMTAMENATRNSGEMIKKLNLLYNRTRQAYITKELIEIISGSEAAA